MSIGAPPTRSPINKQPPVKFSVNNPTMQPAPAPPISAEWLEFFSDVFIAIQALQQSGTTAQRPTKGLYVGRPYFDTSLGAKGKPIWVDKNGTGWVLADGTVA